MLWTALHRRRSVMDVGAANAPTIRRSHHAACFASAIVVPGSTPPGALGGAFRQSTVVLQEAVDDELQHR